MVSLADSSRLKSILAARSWCQECERALHPEVRADSHALTYAHLAQPAFPLLDETGSVNSAAYHGQVFTLINTTFTKTLAVQSHLGKSSLSHLSQIILDLSSWQWKVIITSTLIQILQLLQFTKRQNPKDYLFLYISLDTTCLLSFVTNRMV